MCPQQLTLSTRPSRSHPIAPGLCVFFTWEGGDVSSNPRLWFCNLTGWHQLMRHKNLLCSIVIIVILILHILILICSIFLPSTLKSVIFHLLWNQPTSPHDGNKVQNWSSKLQTHQLNSNHQQGHGIHHRIWNQILSFHQQPHLRALIRIQTRSLYLGHTACTPNNGWRPSMSDMRSGPSLWTYLMLFESLASHLALQTVWNTKNINWTEKQHQIWN